MLSPPSRNQSVSCPSVYGAVAATVMDGSRQTIHRSLRATQQGGGWSGEKPRRGRPRAFVERQRKAVLRRI